MGLLSLENSDTSAIFERMKKLTLYVVLTTVLMTANTTSWACATCFGKSDAAMAQGMNMGILSLMAVIGAVLAGISSFFVFIARRSHLAEGPDEASDLN